MVGSYIKSMTVYLVTFIVFSIATPTLLSLNPLELTKVIIELLYTIISKEKHLANNSVYIIISGTHIFIINQRLDESASGRFR